MVRSAAIAALLGAALSANAQKVFFETFEGVTLGTSKEEAAGSVGVWTKTPPTGWTLDDSQMPGIGNPATDGVVEWSGWSFANKDWWVRVAGDQRRADFTFGTGTVLIADPDEWDDAAHAKGLWTGFISTPEIDLTGVAANSLVLAFDSSWRPEAKDDPGASFPTAEDGSPINNQTGLVRVTFNAGSTNEIVRFESTRTLDDGSDNPYFKEDKTKSDASNPDEISNTNEPFIVPLGNPAGGKVKLTLGMILAANDWWWAVDNIAIGVPPLVTGVAGNGVSARARISEALGKNVDDTKPVTLSIDGAVVPGAQVSRDGSLVYAGASQAPKVFTPGSKHTVSVTFSTTDGRTLTDGGEFIAPSFTTVASTPAVITATVTSPSYFTVDASKAPTLKLNGTAVTPTSVTPFTTDTTSGLTIRYGIATPLPPGSANTFEVTFTTTDNVQVVDAVKFVAATYKTLDAQLATALGTASQPGMRWRTHQLATGRDNSTALVEEQLKGALGPSIHDTTGQNAQGYFDINVVNFEQAGAAAGIFSSNGLDDLYAPEDVIPGIPGILPDGNTSTDNIGGEAVTFVEIPAPGIYTMVVRSDDGFQVSAGILSNPVFQVLGGFDGGRGDGPTEFYFQATKAGVYLFRLLWYEGGGGASVEWYTVNASGTPALVGGSQTGALKAFKSRPGGEPTLTSIPATVAAQPKGAELFEGESTTLVVAANGDNPISYQWNKNGVAIPGATKATLTLSKVTAASAGSYTATVSNAGGTNNSLPAVISVIARSRSKVLLSENFDGLPLGPNVEEGIVTGSGGQKEAVVTKTPPSGWAIDNSGMVGLGDPTTDGVVEWAGWSFANREWWAATAGDQTRTQFKKGVGAVAIADGDEWDDQPRTKPANMNTFLATKPINVAGLNANSVLLKFDSSWRPESPQKAVIRVAFDGGAASEILRWVGDSADANFHPDAQNESVAVRINNPANASTMTITFGYIDAGNNWWWALDNIEVSADPAGYDPIADGLATYLPFDGNLTDASSKGVNGTAVGTPTFVAGKVGQAVNVRTTQAGEFSYVTLGRQILVGTNSATVSFWAKLNSNTGDPSFVGNKDWGSGGNVGFVLATAGDSRIQWNLNTVGGSRKDFDSAGGVFANQAWKHIVVAFDRNALAETWVDGVKVDARDISANIGQVMETDTLALNVGQDGTGKYTDGGSVFFNADLDEVAIWKRALTDAEVATIYSRGAAGQGVLSKPAGTVVDTTPPAGLGGGSFSNVVIDEANKTITADLPAAGDQGYLTISPARAIKGVEKVGNKIIIRY
jgi:hypothetical protein